MDKELALRQALREVVAEVMCRACTPRSPRPIDPYEDEWFLAILDVQRAMEAGCRTPDEVISFLHIEDEGWFFEDRVRTKAEIKLLEATWNKVLEKEGMPEELEWLAGLGVDVEGLADSLASGSGDFELPVPLKEVLSTREQEVFRLHLRGLSQRDIAQVLGLSRRRVRDCLRTIRTKLTALRK